MIQNLLLSLDASTKVIGYCVYDSSTKVIKELKHFDNSNKHDIIEKALEFEKWLLELLKEYPGINEMVIEEAFVAMNNSTSDALTVARLNQINALIRFICFQQGLKTNTIGVRESRLLAYPGYSFKQKAKAGGLNHKEQAFLLVLAEIGDFYFPTKIVSRGKNKGEVRYEDFCKDMSDAYILAKSFTLKKEGFDPKAIRLANKKKKV